MAKQKKEENQKFIIRYGVGAGMNDQNNFKIVTALSLESAENEARENACETYHSYDYTNYGLDEDASEEEIAEDMEDWIEYEAFPFSEKKYNEIIEKHGKQAIE